jgi:hypothetical protein
VGENLGGNGEVFRGRLQVDDEAVLGVVIPVESAGKAAALVADRLGVLPRDGEVGSGQFEVDASS